MTDATDYNEGGINMTGLQMVNGDDKLVKDYLVHWQTVSDPSIPGAGQNRISVSTPSSIEPRQLTSQQTMGNLVQLKHIYTHC